MEGYVKFTPSGDWDKDMKQYRYVAEGHVARLDRRISELKPPLGNPGGQLQRIHQNRLAELKDHRQFWADQHLAALHDTLLEPDGQVADAPEWAHCHQSLRAEAIRFGRLIHSTAFAAYVTSGSTPDSIVAPQKQATGSRA